MSTLPKNMLNIEKIAPVTESPYSQHNNHPKPQTRAVVHIGAYETGTPSIQSLADVLKNELRKDGYEIPRVLLNETIQGFITSNNQAHFASCFLSPEKADDTVYPCVLELLISRFEIAEQGKNLLVTAEAFDKMYLKNVF